MTAILFLKLGQITIRLTFLAIYFCANLMNLDAIFQIFEHLNNFEIIGYHGHFIFQNKAKIFLRQARTFHGLSLHSKAIAPIIREK